MTQDADTTRLIDTIKLAYLDRLHMYHDKLAYGYLATYKINNQPPSLDNCNLCPLGHLVAVLIQHDYPITPIFTKTNTYHLDYDVAFSFQNASFNQFLPDALLQLIQLSPAKQKVVAHMHDVGSPFSELVDYIQTNF